MKVILTTHTHNIISNIQTIRVMLRVDRNLRSNRCDDNNASKDDRDLERRQSTTTM
jgi:predicted ATP-dependent endonuclease of OLD family